MMEMVLRLITVMSSYFTEYLCHVYVRSDNLAGVLISDHEYPQRVAFTLLNKVRNTSTTTNII